VKLAVTEGFDSYLWLIEVNGVFQSAPVTAEHPSNSQFEYYLPKPEYMLLKFSRESVQKYRQDPINSTIAPPICCR